MAGQISVSASGFAALPATAPAGWPPGVVWPGGQLPNGTRTMQNIPDSDMIMLLTWVAVTQIPQATPPTSVTAGQILIALVGNWITGLKQAVQGLFTTPPTIPPPINLV